MTNSWKHVWFDYDDTLVDTVGSRIPAIIEYCRDVQCIGTSEEEILKIWGIPFKDMMRELGCKQDVVIDEYLSIAANHPIKPFAESEEVLNRLSSRTELGIITSVARSILLRDLDALGWSASKFKEIVAQEDTEYHKPDPRVFDSALSKAKSAGVAPESILYVGNAMSDAEAALSAGLGFLGVARTAAQRELFRSAGVDFSNDLKELCTLVRPREIRP